MRMNVRSQYGQEHGLSTAQVASRGTSVGRTGKRFNASIVRSRRRRIKIPGTGLRTSANLLKGFSTRSPSDYARSPRIHATAIGKSQDEIFVMLFCRSSIQSAFMQKAQSSPTIILRNVASDRDAANARWRLE